MRYLIFSDIYLPEKRLITQELSLLCNRLNTDSNSVVLSTYHLSDKVTDIEIDKKEQKKGIIIIRAGVRNIKKYSNLPRGIFELLNPLVLILKSFKELFKADVVLVFSPSIFLAFFTIVFCKILKKNVILNVQDISPQNAIDIGLINNKIVISILKKIERINYHFANKIVVNTYESKNYLENKRQILHKNIKVFYPWIEHEFSRVEARVTKEEFGNRFNLPLSNNDFIIVFTGTIGPYQDLNMIIDISKLLEDTDIKFLIFGSGIYMKNLKYRVNELDIKNIFFHNAIYGRDFSDLLEMSDIGLATLDTRNTTGPIPGKIITYMSNKLPVIALVNSDHKDIKKIFSNNDCGLLLDPNSGKKENAVLLQKLVTQKKDLQIMADNALKFSINNFDQDKILPKYIEFISER